MQCGKIDDREALVLSYNLLFRAKQKELRCLIAGALETGKPPGLTGCLNRIFTPPVKYGKERSIHLSKMRVYGLNQALQTCARRFFFFFYDTYQNKSFDIDLAS